jgi:KDO2-lipid IV(A) lauroyltransferase
MLTHLLLRLIATLARLPLPWLRSLGCGLGYVLWAMVPSRRRVVRTNLQLCFPNWSASEIDRQTRQTFVYFAQAWLDRGWLWHGNTQKTRDRLHLTGAVTELQGDQATVIFAPHFVGLDAAWTGLTQQLPRHFTTIYTNQSNPIADAWILQGRQRYANTSLLGRSAGVKTILSNLKQGGLLYLLPDMNFGPHESVYVPFYGIPAATVPSLSRFAKLGRAKVVPVLGRMTATGYDIEVLRAWAQFPSADLVADTARMNLHLQDYIGTMPAQYYWVHKRFKDQPEGRTPPY